MLANRIRMNSGEKKFEDLSGSPGASKLLAGDESAGFFGEVEGGDLITGGDLLSQVGLAFSRGLVYPNAPYLKFSLDGTILFVYKKNLICWISWNRLEDLQLLTGRPISIGGFNYKIRSLKGTTRKNDEIGLPSGIVNHESEWNRLLLPLVEQAPSNWMYPDSVNSPTKKWANYSSSELSGWSGGSEGVGALMGTWCPDTAGNVNWKVRRANHIDLSFAGFEGKLDRENIGWRPVLQLIP